MKKSWATAWALAALVMSATPAHAQNVSTDPITLGLQEVARVQQVIAQIVAALGQNNGQSLQNWLSIPGFISNGSVGTSAGFADLGGVSGTARQTIANGGPAGLSEITAVVQQISQIISTDPGSWNTQKAQALAQKVATLIGASQTHKVEMQQQRNSMMRQLTEGQTATLTTAQQARTIGVQAEAEVSATKQAYDAASQRDSIYGQLQGMNQARSAEMEVQRRALQMQTKQTDSFAGISNMLATLTGATDMNSQLQQANLEHLKGQELERVQKEMAREALTRNLSPRGLEEGLAQAQQREQALRVRTQQLVQTYRQLP